MASIIITCPKCSARYSYDVAHIGRRGQCKKCNTVFDVEPGTTHKISGASDAELAARMRIPHFECDVPSGDGRCSDNNCPCPELVISRGSGYLYIDQGIVDFRCRFPSMKAAEAAMQRHLAQLRAKLRASGSDLAGGYRLGPILVCEEGAKLRNLDLVVAGADARYWWNTGKVPLRPTPLAGTRQAKEERRRLGLETGGIWDKLLGRKKVPIDRETRGKKENHGPKLSPDHLLVLTDRAPAMGAEAFLRRVVPELAPNQDTVASLQVTQSYKDPYYIAQAALITAPRHGFEVDLDKLTYKTFSTADGVNATAVSIYRKS